MGELYQSSHCGMQRLWKAARRTADLGRRRQPSAGSIDDHGQQTSRFRRPAARPWRRGFGSSTRPISALGFRTRSQLFDTTPPQPACPPLSTSLTPTWPGNPRPHRAPITPLSALDPQCSSKWTLPNLIPLSRLLQRKRQSMDGYVPHHGSLAHGISHYPAGCRGCAGDLRQQRD